MNFKKLFYFKTIVEQGQISRAARVLNISQPPLSQRLKELEESLDTVLIERTGNNWVVTNSGKALYRKALQILDLVEDIPFEIQEAQHQVNGLVRIGCTPLSLSLIQKFIPRFNRIHPDVSFRLFSSDSTILHRMLHEQVLDFCVMLTPPSSSDLEITLLPSSRLCAVIPTTLAPRSLMDAPQEERALSLEELNRFPLIIFRRFDGGGLYQHTLDLFAAQGLVPNIVMDCPDCSTLLKFMDNQFMKEWFEAAAVVPVSEVPPRFYQSHVVCALPDLMPVIRPCIATIKKRYLPKAAAVAWDELKKLIAKTATGG